MTISVVIFIICLVILLLFSCFLCAIIIKRKSDEKKSLSEIEKGQDMTMTVRPPTRKRKYRPDDGLHRSDIHFSSPKMVRVPFNSPDERKYRRKEFQPMNRDKRAKKSKREKGDSHGRKKVSMSSKTDNGEKRILTSEYYSSQVSVCPLNFSEKIYTRNHITETLFAGSIHRGFEE